MENKPISEVMEIYGPLEEAPLSKKMVDDDFLAHYGVLGMRWGVRRFQPYSLIPRKSGEGGKEVGAAKKASKGSSDTASSNKSKSNKSRNQKSKEAKERVEEEIKTNRQRKEELNKLVKSGDAKAIYERRHEMSEQQLNDAIRRINTEAQLANLVRAQNPRTIDKITNLAKGVKDVNSIIGTGIDSYKTANSIKKLIKDNKRYKKEEASANVLDSIIDAGNKDVDIQRLQSKLTKNDLKVARERLSELNQIEKSIRSHDKQRRNDARAAEDHLKNSLKDIEAGKERVENEWGTKDIKPVIKPTKRNLESARTTLKRDAQTFNLSNEINKDFDDYFNSEVNKQKGRTHARVLKARK